MTFRIITKANLFDTTLGFDAIAQGVNCQGVMGAGIAVLFRDSYPKMYTAYQKLCKDFPDIIPGSMQHYEHRMEWIDEKNQYDMLPSVYNLFTQVQPGRNADYGLLSSAVLAMRHHAEDWRHQHVGMPWIGAGIGGLAKHNVEHILRRILTESAVQFTLVEQ